MKLIALTGNQQRHKFFADYLSRHHDLVAVFAEDRFDKNSYGSDYCVLKQHFNLRTETEKKFFSSYDFPKSTKLIGVPKGKMSEPKVENEIKKIQPEGIAVLGSGLIKENIIGLCDKFVNMHQGLSPYYRGSGTNFWPFYYEEPEYVGVTIHYIDIGADSGNITCHGRPEIEPGDSLHDIGCKTIMVSAQLVTNVFNIMEQRDIPGIVQWDEGREFKRKDFDHKAVERVCSLFENGLIEKYLVRKNDKKSFVRLITLEN